MLKNLFLTLATVCLPHLIFTHTSNDLVKNHYPNAYTWYLSISEKYPDAKLNTIDFCISDHHHAKKHSIYFPLSSIEFIENSHNLNHKTDETAKKLAVEEYLLLHEAAHALNNDYLKGQLAKILTILAGTASYISTISKTTTLEKALLENTLTASMLFAGIFAYARLQEKNADHFANQNADSNALEAGINWHKQNKSSLNIDENSSNAIKLIEEQISDLAHPRPTKRQERAQNTYNQRFYAKN